MSALRAAGVSASASRAGAGRLAGRVAAMVCRHSAGDRVRTIMNIRKLILVVTFVASIGDLRNPRVPRIPCKTYDNRIDLTRRVDGPETGSALIPGGAACRRVEMSGHDPAVRKDVGGAIVEIVRTVS